METTEGFCSYQYRVTKCRSQSKQYAKRHSFAHDITTQDLIDQFEKQNGKCYYSGIQMSTLPHSNWLATVERLDQSIGYTKSNIVFACQEFNGPKQWSLDKVELIPQLREKTVDEYYLKKVIHDATISISRTNQQTPNRKQIIIHQCNGDDLHFCHCCNTYYTSNLMSNDLRTLCKKCRSAEVRRRQSTTRGYLQALARNMRANVRKSSSRVRRSLVCELELQDILDLINLQDGRCFYSGIPMTYAPLTYWQCSPERLDCSLGYTHGNVVLICAEFNTVNNATRSVFGDVNGSGQWSKEKFEIFYNTRFRGKKKKKNDELSSQ